MEAETTQSSGHAAVEVFLQLVVCAGVGVALFVYFLKATVLQTVCGKKIDSRYTEVTGEQECLAVPGPMADWFTPKATRCRNVQPGLDDGIKAVGTQEPAEVGRVTQKFAAELGQRQVSKEEGRRRRVCTGSIWPPSLPQGIQDDTRAGVLSMSKNLPGIWIFLRGLPQVDPFLKLVVAQDCVLLETFVMLKRSSGRGAGKGERKLPQATTSEEEWYLYFTLPPTVKLREGVLQVSLLESSGQQYCATSHREEPDSLHVGRSKANILAPPLSASLTLLVSFDILVVSSSSAAEEVCKLYLSMARQVCTQLSADGAPDSPTSEGIPFEGGNLNIINFSAEECSSPFHMLGPFSYNMCNATQSSPELPLQSPPVRLESPGVALTYRQYYLPLVQDWEMISEGQIRNLNGDVQGWFLSTATRMIMFLIENQMWSTLDDLLRHLASRGMQFTEEGCVVDYAAAALTLKISQDQSRVSMCARWVLKCTQPALRVAIVNSGVRLGRCYASVCTIIRAVMLAVHVYLLTLRNKVIKTRDHMMVNWLHVFPRSGSHNSTNLGHRCSSARPDRGEDSTPGAVVPGHSEGQ